MILVDEASQLGTRDMTQLFDLAGTLNARVVFVGDRRQHRSVTAGEPLRLLEEKAGLRVAELREIVRQDREYKKAAGLLSKGEIEEAFKELHKLGWIREVPDGDRFGYLRGIRDEGASVEFRFRDGNSAWFPYGWLGPWRYNPSEGLLLKFSGDLVYVVLIRGSNLDKPLNDGAINLTTGGLQRRRVLWVREMTEEEIRQVGDTGPTVDTIQVAEFESQSILKEWLAQNAPAFLQGEK